MRGALIGAGYFSAFHVDAWARIDEAKLVGIADLELDRAGALAGAGVEPFDDVERMLDELDVDFVDIATPPGTHHELVVAAAARGLHVICQKPLAPTFAEATALVEAVGQYDVRFMVHENFRWQPWYRVINGLIEDGVTGRPFHASFVMRTGDGWQDDAYLARQPYFRDYPRLLFHETGVHLIDTFRYLFGEVSTVFAKAWQRNPGISGEDAGVVMLEFESGASAVFDASRYNEMSSSSAGPPSAGPRYTFGSLRLDAAHGHAELNTEGVVRWTPLGQEAEVLLENAPRSGFAGDSVLALQQHFVEQVTCGQPFESEGADYLKTVEVVEACYRSAETGEVQHVPMSSPIKLSR